MGKIAFKNCTVEFYEENGFTKTTFKDNSCVPAFPHYDNKYYLETAKKLGYGDNLKDMCIDHEILHTIVAEQLDLPYSFTLWAVAHPNSKDNICLNDQYYEEAIVLAIQKYIKTNAITEDIKDLTDEALNSIKQRYKSCRGNIY